MNDNSTWKIIHGDALKLLGEFSPGSFDAVITDPPYASGGRTQVEKSKSTAKKYSSMGENAPPAFDGDAKDQRSWTRWAAEWLSDARRVCKPGAPGLQARRASASHSAVQRVQERWSLESPSKGGGALSPMLEYFLAVDLFFSAWVRPPEA